MKRAMKTALLLLASLGAVYLFFLIREYAVVKEREILPSLLGRWHGIRAFAFAMDWAAAFQAAAILVSFGLFRLEDGHQAGRAAFMVTAKEMILLSLFMALTFGALNAFSLPKGWRDERKMRQVSRRFNQELKAAEKAVSEKRWPDALPSLEACESIDPKDRRFAQLRAAYDQRQVPEAAPPDSPGLKDGPDKRKLTEMSANGYYLKALEARKSGDFYTAHSMATRAYRIDPGRVDAQRLAAELWENIASMEDSLQETAKRKIAQRKREAYKRLKSGDPIGAYGDLLALGREAPEDQDIGEYLKESLEEAKRISFFLDEVAKLERYPKASGVFFRVPAGGGHAFVACRAAYWAPEKAYLSGLEYLVLESGKVRLRLAAPYAKLQGGRLLLSCYDREDPSKAFLPAYLAGGPPNPMDNLLEVSFDLDGLKTAAIGAGDPREATLLEINEFAAKGPGLGLDPRPFIREGLSRIHGFAAFLFLSLFSAYIGYRFRYRGAGSPVLRAVGCGAVAVLAADLLLSSSGWLDRVVADIMLDRLPAAAAVGAYSVGQALLILIAIIMLAGYRDAPSD